MKFGDYKIYDTAAADALEDLKNAHVLARKVINTDRGPEKYAYAAGLLDVAVRKVLGFIATDDEEKTADDA